MKIADVIQVGMDRLGVTPAMVSKDTGLSEPTLSRILKGKHEPRYATLVILARYLELDWAEIEAAMMGSDMPLPADLSPAVMARRLAVRLEREERKVKMAGAVGFSGELGIQVTRAIQLAPLAYQRASMGPGSIAESETVPYSAESPNPHHIGVTVTGNCLEPDVPSGASVIVDTAWTVDIPDGRLVMAIHEGEALVKWLRTHPDGSRWLESNTLPPIRISGETHIGGVVVRIELEPPVRH